MQMNNDFSGTMLFFKEAQRVIYNNRLEFEDYRKSSQKLAAVKKLKEYTGGGLKECKEVCDLYWENGYLPNFLKEDRKLKLEKLAKVPLINEIVKKIKNIPDEELFSIFSRLSVDELLSIDESLENK